jgi:hypothetical protein
MKFTTRTRSYGDRRELKDAPELASAVPSTPLVNAISPSACPGFAATHAIAASFVEKLPVSASNTVAVYAPVGEDAPP